jgi:hypothetical protein
VRLFALAVVLALLAPLAQAKEGPAPQHPPELVALLPGWVADAEALVTDADRAKPWWPEAESFLTLAKAAQAEGRFRVTLFHLETFRELVIGNRLLEESAAEGAGGKSFVLQRTGTAKQEADAAWLAYRAKLHTYDGQLRSLQTVEKALYSADIALVSALGGTEYEPLAREYPKQEGAAEGYVFGLVRASYTMRLNIEWAEEALAKAVEQEGVPPEIDLVNWTNLTNASIQYGLTDEPPAAFLEAHDKLARPARENGEGLLAVAFVLAEQRSTRSNNMQTIFGDARTRGLDVVNDAARGMRRTYNNTTLELPQSYGLTGVFTADAIDRAQITLDYLGEEKADLGTVIVAWAALDHANYALNALAALSPVAPPPTPTNDAPGAPVIAAIAVLTVGALAWRRRH